MLVNLKVRTCIVLVLVLFTGAMFISNGVAWMGLNSSNEKLEQINKAYGEQASQLSRAYSVFLRARLVLSTSLMDMQQGKTEQAGAQAKRSEGLMQDGYKMLDTFRKVRAWRVRKRRPRRWRAPSRNSTVWSSARPPR